MKTLLVVWLLNITGEGNVIKYKVDYVVEYQSLGECIEGGLDTVGLAKDKTYQCLTIEK